VTVCWIWELGCNGNDYAAWIQAIGSILALVIVIGIERHQNKREIAKIAATVSNRHYLQIRNISFLVSAMHELLERHFGSSTAMVTYDKVALTESSGDLLNLIRSLSLDDLDDFERSTYLSTRRLFSEIFSHIHFGDENAYADNHMQELQQLKSIFAQHQGVLKTTMTTS
jgi:hypothetical protein